MKFLVVYPGLFKCEEVEADDPDQAVEAAESELDAEISDAIGSLSGLREEAEVARCLVFVEGDAVAAFSYAMARKRIKEVGTRPAEPEAAR